MQCSLEQLHVSDSSQKLEPIPELRAKSIIWDILKDGEHKKFFLSIVCNGIEVASKGISLNAIKPYDIFQRKYARLFDAKIDLPDFARSQVFSSRSLSPPQKTPGEMPCGFLPKRQYRVVFRGTCLLVHGIQTFTTSHEVRYISQTAGDMKDTNSTVQLS